MPVSLITPCAFFYHMQNGPAWNSLFVGYFMMGIAAEFGPGNPPSEGNLLKILLRSAKVIGEGIAGMMGFGMFFVVNMAV